MWFVLVQVILFPSSHMQPMYVWWTGPKCFKENFVVSRALIPPNLGNDNLFCKLSSRNNWVDSGYLRLTSTSHLPLLTYLSKMKAKIYPLNYRYICWWEKCLGLLHDRGSKIFMFWEVCIFVGESWFWLLLCVKQYGVHSADWMFWRFQPILVFRSSTFRRSDRFSRCFCSLYVFFYKAMTWAARNWGNLGGTGAVLEV